MATYYLCPFASFLQVLSDAGQVVTNALVWTYAAGTSTPTPTWTDNTGGTPNGNPIQLNSAGRLNNVSIWQQGGVPIKVIFTTNVGTPSVPVAGPQIGPTFDQVSGINDPSSFGATLLNPATGSGADLVANAVRSYDTFTSLRAANVPVLTGGQTLIIGTEGGAGIGDGLGGFFYWSATSSATDDSLNVIKPNAVSGNGRYLRLAAQGTFSIPLTGFTGAVSCLCSYSSSNGVVALNFGQATGTSNTATMTAPSGTLPVPARPINTVYCLMPLEDNGVTSVVGQIAIFSDGTLSFGKVVGTDAGFTGSGTKGITQNWTIAFPTNSSSPKPFPTTTHTYVANATDTIPNGATTAVIEVWGAGGGGGPSNPAGDFGGGGGATGGYVRSVVSVALQNAKTFTVTVGSGGAPGNPGATGGTSSVANGTFSGLTTMTASGGTGGGGANIGGPAGTGGSGGSAVGGTAANVTGNNGNAGSGPLGGGGGAGIVGVNGTGNGGGNGGTGSGSQPGTSGGAGLVIITYT